MFKPVERRKRGQQPATPTSVSEPKADIHSQRSGGLAQNFLVRNIPLLFALPVLIVVAWLFFNTSSSTGESAALGASSHGSSRKLLGIADVEDLTARMSINGTVVLVVCPKGYEEFFHNWQLSVQNLSVGSKFLVLAEDEETYTAISATHPENAVLRMDVKEPLTSAADSKNGVQRAVPESADALAVAALEAAYRKVVYAREIMNAGHNVVLCDVTAVWLRDPFADFKGADVFATVGDRGDKRTGSQLQADFPSKSIVLLQEPKPRGVGKLPPLGDEFVFFQNNVGAWVSLDYWAVVLEGLLESELKGERKPEGQQAAPPAADTYTHPATASAFTFSVTNAVKLSPRPRIGVLPPGRYPPASVFFGDDAWRESVRGSVVVAGSKLGAHSKEEMKERLLKAGLWKLGGAKSER